MIFLTARNVLHKHQLVVLKFTRAKMRTNHETFKSELLALIKGKNNKLSKFIKMS